MKDCVDIWRYITRYWQDDARVYTAAQQLETHIHTDSEVHPRDQAMEKAPYKPLFPQGDWAVVSIPETNIPWIVHWCLNPFNGREVWNYVLSSPVSLEHYKDTEHFHCIQCKEMAPDDTITVCRMMTK
jgi:hypothetical protein